MDETPVLFCWHGELVVPADVSAADVFAAVVVEEAASVAPPGRDGQPAAVAASTVEIVVGDVVIRAPEAAGTEHLARAIRAARLAAP